MLSTITLNEQKEEKWNREKVIKGKERQRRESRRGKDNMMEEKQRVREESGQEGRQGKKKRKIKVIKGKMKVCVFHIFFIHSFADGHLGWFHIEAIENTTEIRMGVKMAPWQNYIISSGYVFSVENAGSSGHLYSIVWDISMFLFPALCWLVFLLTGYIFSILTIAHQHILLKQIIETFRRRQRTLKQNQSQCCILRLERNSPRFSNNQL